MRGHDVRLQQWVVSMLLRGWILAVLLVFAPLSHAAEGVDVVQAHLENSDDGVKLSATFAFELNRGLEDAITHGVPLYFTTEVELTRPRWYWFDEQSLTESQTIRLSYNVLTRQYHAAILGRLQQSFSSLDDALSLIRRPSRWLIADKSALKPGAVYTVAVRMRLDVAQLPKPFQVNAINNADWRLSSDWKIFSYKAE
ncbi:hypothetical protein RCH09_000967 [Actimicrobium sp. GrIS 1.19]|uniref:DUF4390 domain-containing protein n=1 Tax=Actimicrobium sp. GrIS 1.19 TaxID=3071708 RepID=UPI002DF823BB|nr:hypothetical protein [Actimicrobium sp. GrIS 1.19]